jgi:hypothetical protein
MEVAGNRCRAPATQGGKMSASVRAVMDGSIRWPARCVKCGSLTTLRLFKAEVRTAISVSPLVLLGDVFGASWSGVSVQYPVCAEHERMTRITEWITRRAGIPAVLRFITYYFVAMLVLGSIRFAATSTLPDLNPLHWSVLVWACLFGNIGFVLVRKSSNWVPVRFGVLDDGVAEIRFYDDDYARQFIILNPQQTDPSLARKSAWYAPQNRGVTLGLAILIPLVIMYVIVSLFGHEIFRFACAHFDITCAPAENRH